jgi:hypothetical protein
MSAKNITVLISARKNSKYLAKFFFGLFENTELYDNLDVRVIMNEHDTWNAELARYWDFSANGWQHSDGQAWIRFYRENLRLGRAGLHEYFNLLLKDGHIGDWVIYFCEDHFINDLHPGKGWDAQLLDYAAGKLRSGDSEGKTFPLNPDDVWVIVPQFDNAGAMNHVLSRGFIRALGDKVGQHGWIDSYINDLMRDFPDRVIRVDEPWFHDFTHDKPSPMSDAHLQGTISTRGKNLPAYDSSVTRHRLELDKEAIKKAIEREERS